MLAHESEATLVARAVQRDAEAFSELYSLYFARVYRYVRLRVGNQPDAEDLTSMVFLRAWNAIDHFAPKHEASFAGWLFKLAHSLVVDRYRRTHDTASLDDGQSRDESDPHSTTEAELEWRLTISELHQALRALTDEQREVVVLRFVEGLSAREVGDRMGKQEGTVRGMQFRAILALRRALGGGGGKQVRES
ncbi:MAG TPA: sigma-70 family RNA polymerase sigma factor [Ktedonobacterales bacterium]|nr:sigma-70 family RNA polymerase sigma factor [Ktedonobacterales bacterium]